MRRLGRGEKHQRRVLGLPKSGFTLIELLTVIAIIGILAALIFTPMIMHRKCPAARQTRGLGMSTCRC